MTEMNQSVASVSLQHLRWYFAVLIAFWGLSLFWWVELGYEGSFVWMNQFRWEVLSQSDLYFFTHLGDGLILPGLIVLLFWRRDPGLATTAAIAILACGLLSVLGKTTLFVDWARPARIFEGFPTVEIVHPHPPKSRAFPSGHATVVAAGGVYFAFFLGQLRQWLPFLVGLITVFLCLSRVVIGVHFPADVFVGSMIGSIGGALFLGLLYPVLHRRMKGLQTGRYPVASAIVLVCMAALILFQFVNLIRNT